MPGIKCATTDSNNHQASKRVATSPTPSDNTRTLVCAVRISQASPTPQVEEVGTKPLADDKLTLPSGDDEVDWEQEYQRHKRVQAALGLFVHWAIPDTDFSQKHDYPGVQWLQYSQRGDGCSRVYIGNKTTWRGLYVACNQAIEKQKIARGKLLPDWRWNYFWTCRLSPKRPRFQQSMLDSLPFGYRNSNATLNPKCSAQ